MKPLTHDLVLTQFDHHRLQRLLQLLRARSNVNPWKLRALELELKRARTVASDAIPSTVITMNSKFVLRDVATGACVSLTLVFPAAGATAGEHVSVLSALGLALLGRRV